MTKAMAIDHGAQGIRVNCVCPGDVETPMLPADAKMRGIKWDDYIAGCAKRPLGRVGTVEEIAKAVLFLASDDSSFMTGAALVVDGGERRISQTIRELHSSTVQKSGLKTATVFLGGGRITSALCEDCGWRGIRERSCCLRSQSCEAAGTCAESRASSGRRSEIGNSAGVDVDLAVRPASVPGCSRRLRGWIAPGLCVSLAAGVPLSTLRRSAEAVRFVRALCRVRCAGRTGLTAITFDRAVTRVQRGRC